MPTLSACHTIAAQPPVPAVWNHRVWLGEVAGAFGDIGTFILDIRVAAFGICLGLVHACPVVPHLAPSVESELDPTERV